MFEMSMFIDQQAFSENPKPSIIINKIREWQCCGAGWGYTWTVIIMTKSWADITGGNSQMEELTNARLWPVHLLSTCFLLFLLLLIKSSVLSFVVCVNNGMVRECFTLGWTWNTDRKRVTRGGLCGAEPLLCSSRALPPGIPGMENEEEVEKRGKSALCGLRVIHPLKNILVTGLNTEFIWWFAGSNGEKYEHSSAKRG